MKILHNYLIIIIIEKKYILYIYKMASAWIEHVKAYAKKNKVTYKEAMSKAKATYKVKDKKVMGKDKKK